MNYNCTKKDTMKKLIIVISLFLGFVHNNSISAPNSFSAAKRVIPEIYKGMEETIYCGCSYSYKGKKLIPDLESCGYKVRKEEKRANRIEWEHIVPAEHVGRSHACWKKRDQFPECRKSNGKFISGRRCCSKVDPEFKKATGNLHNLAPSIGEVNGNRSNYRFSQLTMKADQYGQCQAKTDFKSRKFEPRDEVKGDVARVNFYFESKGYIKISKSQRRLFQVWDKQDPVSDYECKIHDRKAKIQGEVNSFVSEKCKILH